YDVILVDCPPALNMLTVNALVAADSVLIPMQCEYYALEGLSALLGTIEQIRVAANPQLEIEGILRTMFDPRNNLSNEVSAQLLMHFGDKVFRTVIPRNIRLAEAPSFGRPVLFHDKESRGGPRPPLKAARIPAAPREPPSRAGREPTPSAAPRRPTRRLRGAACHDPEEPDPRSGPCGSAWSGERAASGSPTSNVPVRGRPPAGRRGRGGAGRLDQGSGRGSADRGAPDRRGRRWRIAAIRDHRGRAALARCPDRRPRRHSGGHSPHTR